MYTLEEIDSQLVSSDNAILPSSFVAAAVQLNEDGEANHAGIVICDENNYFVFHFIRGILIDTLPNGQWFFHKPIENIFPDLVPAFVSHCKVIERKAKPEFGFFYGGSHYDSNGIFFSKNTSLQLMSCVGFCINVILGFLEEEVYFDQTTWPVSEGDENYFDKYVKQLQILHPDANIEVLRQDLRRIYPIDFISSAFLKELPITKQNIEPIAKLVERALMAKV